MRKIDKITLKKADIDQSDILKKKQMKNLWGGHKWCCHWICTINGDGQVVDIEGYGDTNDECWREGDLNCPFPPYGLRIESLC